MQYILSHCLMLPGCRMLREAHKWLSKHLHRVGRREMDFESTSGNLRRKSGWWGWCITNSLPACTEQLPYLFTLLKLMRQVCLLDPPAHSKLIYQKRVISGAYFCDGVYMSQLKRLLPARARSADEFIQFLKYIMALFALEDNL